MVFRDISRIALLLEVPLKAAAAAGHWPQSGGHELVVGREQEMGAKNEGRVQVRRTRPLLTNSVKVKVHTNFFLFH